jgi:TRAP-type C4-dicarboxylate transport system permease small subunit
MHIRLVNVERALCGLGMGAACALLVLLVLISGLNVACRVAGHPIGSTYEISGYLGAVMAALALAETQRRRGHVELDMFTRRYPASAQRRIGAFNVLAGAVLAVLVAVQIAARARALLAAGEVSETLKLPYPWLMFGVAAGLVLLAASFITDFVLMAMGLGNLDAAGKDALKRAGTVNSIRGEIEK